jgi:DNA-directed RNA polymerase specialized sigma subunit
MKNSYVGDWPTHQGAVTPDELVLAALPLIDEVVADLVHRIGPIERDHLTSVALVAALDAATAYDPEQDGPFPRFVSALVRSALLGEIRGGVLRPVPADRVLADPAEDDEPIVALCRELHDLSAREVELVDVLVESQEPTALVRLIQVRTEALMLVHRAMLARDAVPARAPEVAAARGSAFVAVLGRRAMVRRPAAPRWRTRRDA